MGIQKRGVRGHRRRLRLLVAGAAAIGVVGAGLSGYSPLRVGAAAADTLDGTYTITSVGSGKVLSVLDGATGDRARVVQETAGGRRDQQWSLSALDDGSYVVKNVASGKVLDVSGAGSQNGAPVILYRDWGGANQHWRFVRRDGGSYELESVNSGKALDVSYKSRAERAQVWQWAYEGGANQKWTLTPVSAAPVPTPSASVPPAPSTSTSPSASPSQAPSAPSGVGLVSRTYAGSDENFPNPQRGMGVWIQPGASENPANVHLSQNPGQLEYLKREQARVGTSVVRVVYSLKPWRNSPLPQDFLDRVNADFAAARSIGFSMIPYFAYDWAPQAEANDPPVDQIERHIDQLRPVLQANPDVMPFMAAGFIGAWGEGWNSASGNVTPDGQPNGNTRRIWTKLLASVPASSSLVVRTVSHKQIVFGSTPMTPQQAYDGSDRSRVGFHNECYLSNDHGDESGSARRGQFAAYLSAEGMYVPQMDAIDRSCLLPGQQVTCPELIGQLSTTHVDVLLALADGYLDECHTEVAQRLGYRYRLVSSALPTTTARGGTVPVSLDVANDGWAPAHSARPVQLVLRNRATGAVTALPLAGADPRRWLPGATAHVTANLTLPAGVAAGDYDVLLNLPSAQTRTATTPAYSIRLANQGTWEPATGYNSLQRTLTVSP